MSHAAIAAYADWFTTNEVKWANPERLAKLLAENPNAVDEYRASWLARGEELAGDILGKTPAFLKRYLQGLLHPDNKASRALFVALTGVGLPSTVAGTDQAVSQYCGAELEAYQAEEFRKYAEEQAARRAEAEREQAQKLADLRDRFTAKQPVTGEELLTLARSVGIEPHPRTAGTLRTRVISISNDSARTRGGQLPIKVWQVYRDVKAALQVA